MFWVPSCSSHLSPMACPGVQGHKAGIDPKTGPTSLRRGKNSTVFLEVIRKISCKIKAGWMDIQRYVYVYTYSWSEIVVFCYHCYYCQVGSFSQVLEGCQIQNHQTVGGKKNHLKNVIAKFGSTSLGFRKNMFQNTSSYIHSNITYTQTLPATKSGINGWNMNFLFSDGLFSEATLLLASGSVTVYNER